MHTIKYINLNKFKMKLKNLFFAALITITLASCRTSSFYQVYKVAPDDKITLKENLLVYEDENCKVSYNLWSQNGNIGFVFQNTTDKNIFLNMEESFFILNGIASNYYQNREFSNTTSSGTSVSHGANATRSVTGANYLDLILTNRFSISGSVGVTNSAGHSVSYIEEKNVCIPAMTSKIITEFTINESLFRDCALFKYPKKNQIKSRSFSKSESPLVFSNRIVYTVGQTGNPVRFENEFFATQITNFPESEITEKKADEFCGQKDMGQTKSFKNVSPDKFYIKYNKGQDAWKH